MSKLLTTILPSLLAGGLLFGSALTEAQPSPPTPPTAPVPPKPPKPPKAPKAQGQITIDLGDINEMVDEQIQSALEAIGDSKQIPPHVREALKQRLEKVRVKVKKRVAKVQPGDLEEMGEALGEMGEDIGEEMEQFGKDMEKWGKQFEKQVEKQMELRMKQKKLKWKGPHGPHDPWKVQGDVDIDIDDEDLPDMSDMEEADDLDDAIKDLGNLKLDATTRAKLKTLRETSDRQVESAKRELERASEQLQKQLETSGATEVDIARSIDTVTKLEGDIRKARIIAWVKARDLLSADQRKRVEAAARKPK
ncbi:MAG TPA: hypothetical protein VIV11_26220 [Kofleriaceae bacterium]